MNVREGLWRKVGAAGLLAATTGWVFLFRANYWNASMVAFGDMTPYLADLKLTLWKYTAAGVLLATAWIAFLRAALGRHATEEKHGEHYRVREH